jgi:23S rRNA (cytosine1962-C5)-methyltransferase
MPSHPLITLKPTREIPILAGHPWIFSEAIAHQVGALPGTIVEVQDTRHRSLGLGTWNPLTSIRVRMLTRDAREVIDAAFFLKRFYALDQWKHSRLPAQTTGYRLVHAEADGLPGLIVDHYNDCFVFQLHTAGMDSLRTEIIEALRQFASSDHSAGVVSGAEEVKIVERSDLDVRKQEGLTTFPVAIHVGAIEAPVPFLEAGLTFFADVLHGQKTGFFLDQREARIQTGTLAKNRRVLNLFGYTGAFSVHAIKGGASFVNTVDASRSALEVAQKQFVINGLDPEDATRSSFTEADVFDMLREATLPDGPYDFIICDPPALTKDSRHLPQAIKAYTSLNEACLRHLAPGGILVTSSCSGRLEPEAFRSLLRIAAGHANRDVRLLDWVTQPVDHAECLAFPEGRYLKTAILEVSR